MNEQEFQLFSKCIGGLLEYADKAPKDIREKIFLLAILHQQVGERMINEKEAQEQMDHLKSHEKRMWDSMNRTMTKLEQHIKCGDSLAPGVINKNI